MIASCEMVGFPSPTIVKMKDVDLTNINGCRTRILMLHSPTCPCYCPPERMNQAVLELAEAATPSISCWPISGALAVPMEVAASDPVGTTGVSICGAPMRAM